MDAHLWRRRFGLQAGLLALRMPVAEVARELGVGRGYVSYWRQEALTWRHGSNRWGGRRWTKYPVTLEAYIEAYIQFFVVESNWVTTVGKIASALRSLGVTRGWLKARFRLWGWTWAQATARSWHKFTIENMTHYAGYLAWSQTIPWMRLKFADEASYVSRELLPRQTIGPCGTRRRVVYSWTAVSDMTSYSLTGLCGIDPRRPSVSVHVNPGTNTQWTWLEAVLGWLECDALVAGDILVADNAKIHSAEEAARYLQAVLRAARVQLVFLPKYSPELNPMEPIWGASKAWLRYHRGTLPFLQEVACSLSPSVITRPLVFNCFVSSLAHFTN